MSKHEQINIVHNLEDIKKLPQNALVCWLGDKFEINCSNLEEIIPNYFIDPKIGFVYSDLLVVDGDMSIIEYLNGNDLVNVPVIFRNIENINTNINTNIQLMGQFINRQFAFEHIADPLFKMNHVN